MDSNEARDTEARPPDFIRQIILEDLASGKHSRVITRFPPEPNGYLHIGHAKAICLNFGIAREFPQGACHLRFDDTNPGKEEKGYVRAIQEDVRWLGFDWGDRLFFASDYFEDLYRFAVELIEAGKAYVCDLTPEQIREYRGTLTEPGRESPFRDRSVEENLDLFRRMRQGEFPDGSRVLRAKINMASPNLNMRDPALFRIRRAHHHRTGGDWCIYPMYDFTHPISDALEGITHSLCTLEFEDHRPLYDWVLDNTSVPCHPRQIEFARLNLTHTVLSKRKLLTLVREGRVWGWDDPRMPTLSGLRRRGYTPEAIRMFCDRIGLAKRDSVVDISMLEHTLREDLNRRAFRFMAVLRPLKLVIRNYPEGKVEELEAVNNPEDPSAGTRKLAFSREVWVERDDYRDDPPRKWFRLGPGREVRLKHAYLVRCEEVVRDPDTGEPVELRCTYDPESRGGQAPDGRKVRGTLHWVSAPHALEGEVRLFDYLFREPYPGEKGDFLQDLNPRSLETVTGCKLEPGLADARPGVRLQFLRHGYFCLDAKDSRPGRPIFNRTVSLRDTWARIEKKREKS